MIIRTKKGEMMSLKCFLGIHYWNGCKCERCDKERDDSHDWSGCKCERCGRIRNKAHDWNGCKCKLCGVIGDDGHDLDGCKCAICDQIIHDREIVKTEHRTEKSYSGWPEKLTKNERDGRDDSRISWTEYEIKTYRCTKCGVMWEE